MDKEKIPVALLKVEKSCPHDLQNQVNKLWEAAQLKVPYGAKVLVKPNLLRLNPLACSEPDLIVQVCKRLLDAHAKVYVADSPGFGVAEYIAEKLGITPKLKPLGLTVKSFKEYQKITLDLENKEAKLPVAREALEADLIFSLPRIKAHSQMLLTLAVKNCFGVVGGLNKALAHTRYGTRREEFANLLASLFLRLPKVIALVDGRVAMHVSGPSGGKPYHLKLLGAANDAPLMDEVIAQILGLDPKDVPLSWALRSKRLNLNSYLPDFPLNKPNDFEASTFILPHNLLTTSFQPTRLLKSCFKRLYLNLKERIKGF